DMALKLTEQIDATTQRCALLTRVVEQRLAALLHQGRRRLIDTDQKVVRAIVPGQYERIATREYRHIVAVPLLVLVDEQVLALAQAQQGHRRQFPLAGSDKDNGIVALCVVELIRRQRHRVGSGSKTEVIADRLELQILVSFPIERHRILIKQQR